MRSRIASTSDSGPPREPRGAVPHSRDGGDGSEARPVRVYLVEDAPTFRDRLSDFLTEPGEIEMSGFADTESGAARDLHDDPPDAVIVDLHLKEGSGIGVIEWLRKRWPEPPPTIIVLTNYAFPEFEAACRDRGADHFFDKSSEFGDVKALLRSLWRARG